MKNSALSAQLQEKFEFVSKEFKINWLRFFSELI